MGGHRHCGSGLEGRSAVSGGTQTLWVRTGGEGLEANTKYAFEINMVNARFVNPTTNFFTLSTRKGEDQVSHPIVS